MSDDNLEESSRRLGDRFSNVGEKSEPPDPDPPKQEQTDEPEYKPTTLYLPEEIRTELRRFLKRITLDHPEIEDAQKRELHTALIKEAMEHPEEIAEDVD